MGCTFCLHFEKNPTYPRLAGTLLESSNSRPNLFEALRDMNSSLQRIALQCQQIYQGLCNINQYLQIDIAWSSNVSITRRNLLHIPLLPLQKVVSSAVPLLDLL